MYFYLTQNIKQTQNFGMFVFSHPFSVLCEFTHPMFWGLYVFLLHPKYLRNHNLGNKYYYVFGFVWISPSMEIFEKYLRMFVFSHIFRVVYEFTFLMIRNCKDFALLEIFKKPVTLESFYFTILFPHYRPPNFWLFICVTIV